MDFPRHVFKSPGENKIPEGSYDSKLVNDQEGFDKLVNSGWDATILGAVEVSKDEPAKDAKDEAPKAPKAPKA